MSALHRNNSHVRVTRARVPTDRNRNPRAHAGTLRRLYLQAWGLRPRALRDRMRSHGVKLIIRLVVGLPRKD